MVNNFFLSETSSALSSNFLIILNLRFFIHLYWGSRTLNSFTPYWLSFISCWFPYWTVLWFRNFEFSSWSWILISCNKNEIFVAIVLQVKFLLRKIFGENLNEAISLAEIDVSLKVTSISTKETASFRLPRKIFLKKKLTIKLTACQNKFAGRSYFQIVIIFWIFSSLLLS